MNVIPHYWNMYVYIAADIIFQLEKTHNPVNYEELVPVICNGLESNVPMTIQVSLKTLRIIISKGLHDCCKNEAIKKALLAALRHPDDTVFISPLFVIPQVVADAVNVLVLLISNGIDLHYLLPDILDVCNTSISLSNQSFASNSTFLETRGSLILRTLCKKISSESVYDIASQTLMVLFQQTLLMLQTYKDYNVASLIVHMLTIILLTAQETTSLRALLRSCCSQEQDPEEEKTKKKGREIFDKMYVYMIFIQFLVIRHGAIIQFQPLPFAGSLRTINLPITSSCCQEKKSSLCPY